MPTLEPTRPPTPGKPRFAACLCWLLLVFSAPAAAQVFRLEGGSSSLFQGNGGSVEIHAQSYTGSVGIGDLGGHLRFGGQVRTQRHGQTFTLGDDAIPFRLPTDIFDSSHYFLARGIGVAGKLKNVKYYAFGGATSTAFGAGFFRGAQAENPVGALFLEAPLSKTLRAFSWDIISCRQTSINGLEWKARPWLRTALAAGLGQNHGYFASSAEAEREHISAKAAYVQADNQFRRITVTTPLSSEVEGANLWVTVRPVAFVSLSAGHQNFLQPASDTTSTTRGTVDQYQASLSIAHFRTGAVFFDSRYQGTHGSGTSFWLGRDLGRRIQVNGSLFQGHSAGSAQQTTFTGTVREMISTRISLSQLVTRVGGQNTISFGGSFQSNRLSVGAEYQTFYVPFPGRQPFRQALMVSLHLRPFGNFQVNAESYMAPDGRVRYTTSGSTFLYRYQGLAGPAIPDAAVRLDKKIVLGRVVDESGAPIGGATIQIGREVAFSDSEGRFFLRQRKSGPYPVRVLTDQFLVPGKFKVVVAPESVKAEPEDSARGMEIVLRRLKNTTH